MTDNTQLPIDDLAGDKELKEKFGTVTVIPAENPDWAYSLILPKDWIQDDDFEKATAKFEEMAQIGLFGAQGLPVGLQIWATLMPFEVNLSDWLEMIAETGELDLIEMEIRLPETGQCVEALAHVLHGDEPQLVRLTALSSGSRIFLLNGIAEEKIYQSYIKILAIAAVSFMPLKPSGNDLMEEVSSLQDKMNRINVNFPSSWKVEDISPDAERSAIALKLAQDNELVGYLRIQSLEAEFTSEKVLEEIKDNLISSGVSIRSLDFIEKGDWGEKTWVAEATINDSVNECVIVIKPFIEDEEEVKDSVPKSVGGVALVLLCPERERNPYGWMRSKRALEIAVATTRLADSE